MIPSITNITNSTSQTQHHKLNITNTTSQTQHHKHNITILRYIQTVLVNYLVTLLTPLSICLTCPNR